MTTVRRFDSIESPDPIGSVRSWPLITKFTYDRVTHPYPNLSTGLMELPVDGRVSPRFDNCDLQLVILEGNARVCVADETIEVREYDSIYIEAGTRYEIANAGALPVVVLRISPQAYVTSTIDETGETIEPFAVAPATSTKGRS